MQSTPLLIERDRYMQMLRGWHGKNVIKVLTGVRRAGKSTLLQMFAEELRQKHHVSNEQIQFLNFEDLDTLALGDIFKIHTHIKEKLIPDKPNYIFLDEVQNVKDFQRLVDSLYIKPNCDVYITGSNAYLLSGELATLLTGRYIEIEVTPFSYAEYKNFVDASQLDKGVFDGQQKTDFPELLKKRSFGNLANGGVLSPEMLRDKQLFDYLYYGGIPHAAQLGENDDQNENFLHGLLNTIIEKDIFVRNGIYAKASFQKIVTFLMDSIGSFISANSIANIFKSEKISVDPKTVTQYLTYIADSFLFYKVPRFDVKGKNLLRTLEKYYLSDTGFRKIRLPKGKTADIGHMLENAVYLELRRRYNNIFVGKWNDLEIDFIVSDNQGYVSYFQVAYSTSNPDTLERELAPLRAVRDSNPKYLITMDYDFNPVYDGIRKLNAADWLLGKHNA